MWKHAQVYRKILKDGENESRKEVEEGRRNEGGWRK
jgi:hypothetical protein